MLSFSGLCRDLFLLAHAGLGDRPGPRGARWEQRVADYFAGRGVPTESLPGGYSVFGHVSLSGLAHQIDASVGCSDALVIGEWKAYRGSVPKNELLRFKAATDDYFMAMTSALPRRPVMRLFGGLDEMSPALRAYAALHGISLVEPARWPAALLAVADLPLRLGIDGPRPEDRVRLAWLSRPLQHVLRPQVGGAFLVLAPATAAAVESALWLQDSWSDRCWEAVDQRPGSFEGMVARVSARVAA